MGILCGVTGRTVYRSVNNGSLHTYKLGRVIRIRRADLEDFLERCRIAPGSLGHRVSGTDSDREGE